jgi:P27 family predicted phage terminase small subunit
LKNSAPRPPSSLSPEAKRLWRRLIEEYAIEDQGGLAVLQVACEALDRLRDAQQAIDTDGTVVMDRFGQQKAHPLLVVERDARSAFLKAIQHLGLDIEPLKDRSERPGGR